MSGRRRRPRRWFVTGLALTILAPLGGCGVTPQSAPVPVEVEVVGRESASARSGDVTVTVYFVRGTRLHEAERSAKEESAVAALQQLVAGPSRREVSAGTRTALVPQQLTAAPDTSTGPGTVLVSASDELASVSGGNQLLAVAQLVWTLTGTPGVERVRFAVDGRPVEVPTDRGLRSGPVTRSDYVSVEPLPEPSPSSEPSQAPSGTG